MTDTRVPVEVAVGVLFDASGEKILLAQRPEGKVCAGFWEFPGGKIESGETPECALARELEEELGVTCAKPVDWFVCEHSYPHARVRLHYMRVYEWGGTPYGAEGQQFAWFAKNGVPGDLKVLPTVLPALERLGM